MENTSLPTDVYNDITTSASEDGDGLSLYLANIRDLSLKIVYNIIGTVGILDNLFVVVVFILYIKITEKVGLCTTILTFYTKLFFIFPTYSSIVLTRRV